MCWCAQSRLVHIITITFLEYSLASSPTPLAILPSDIHRMQEESMQSHYELQITYFSPTDRPLYPGSHTVHTDRERMRERTKMFCTSSNKTWNASPAQKCQHQAASCPTIPFGIFKSPRETITHISVSPFWLDQCTPRCGPVALS